MEFTKPNIVVSKCLNFCQCRYNNQKLSSKFIGFFENYMNFHPVCPEVEIGLETPRNPVRIIETKGGERLVDSKTGTDYSSQMNEFSDKYLKEINNIDGFILKSKSPTCGIKDVKKYHKAGKVPAIGERTIGFFAKKAMNKFPKAAFEDEGRLRNFSIREHFLIHIFTLAKFRKTKNYRNINKLINFHKNNKYLFMSYSQKLLKKLGKIVSNHGRDSIDTILKNYEDELSNIFSNTRKAGENINAFLHMFGYFSDKLSVEEKNFFLTQIEYYKEEMIPLSVITSILKSWVIRFQCGYLKSQTILNPFPDSLIKVTDSGKGREFR
ncbi:MAG: DUF523 and DUF1722 domain-containing protein [Candidatus Mcinerneyibacterium aminivorans]|uniref:DUF523 and DUF1722 domain-containing protein n=1 Tax=Candidatus Mcinerneyibacterium aminivorans TaxID=2703815 RepID=A0A5D0MFA5_9BACT|nr:MAG: DUF523 and DUF1722 domain-containing protein [Candidatus Mcinerneyibacterium aminivorans]